MYSALLLALAAQCFGTLVQRDLKGVQLPSGRYEGHHDYNTSTTVYYSIPYAHAARFEAPRPIETKGGLTPHALVNASTHGPACINFNLPPPYDTGFRTLLDAAPVAPVAPQQEDCLTLDVYVPDGHHQDLPVLFYIPGSGFLVAASFLYDMEALLSHANTLGKPFIAVVINYRLGPLGLLNPSNAKDWNVAILDQFEALRYVQRYIHKFGGDPNKVTIVGQSAGAESAMHHLLWDEQLFRAVWMMSVPSSGAPFLQTKPHNKDRLIQSYAEACGCAPNKTIAANVACLNATDVPTLVNQSAAWEGSGTSLGGVIRDNVFATLRRGKFPKVPIVVSTCHDEGTNSAIGFNSSSDEVTSYAIQDLINSNDRSSDKQASTFQQQMLEAYPNDPTQGCPYDGQNTTYGQSSQFKRMAAIMTDSVYTEAWTEYLDLFAPSKSWGILFDEPIPHTEPAFGVQHGSDILFYFPTFAGPDADPRNNGLGALVDSIHTALTHFVTDLAPSGSGYEWPQFSDARKVTRLSGRGPTVIDLPHRPGFDVLRNYLRPDGFAT